jgi:hypothetical protein
VPVAVVAEVEAVADEELVGDGEADVAHREALYEPPVRPVEQRHGRERRRAAQSQRLADEVQRQSGVDDVLDEEDVAALDCDVEILQQPHASLPATAGACVAGEGDEVELVKDRGRAAQIGDEDDARLQRRDEDRLAALVVPRNVRAELVDAGFDLLCGEVDLPDPVGYQLARSSLYRSARRAMSRL